VVDVFDSGGKVITATAAEILEQFDLIEVRDNYAIVGEKGQANALADPSARPNMMELGSASPSPFLGWMRKEYNPKLQGLRGLRIYDEMRKSDSSVSTSLLLAKTPVLGARWYMEPGSDSKRDQNVADFVWKCLVEGMSISFNQVIYEAMAMLDFGFYLFEKVWAPPGMNPAPWARDKVTLKKLAPRHPMDIPDGGWEFDINGGPDGVYMYTDKNAGKSAFGSGASSPNGSPYGSQFQAVDDQLTYIPIDKLLVFSHAREAGNIEGISVLRTAYKHWYYKDQLYKIDAIQKERHGIGIPVIILPVGFTDSDKRLAQEMGRNLRTNERAHVVLPPGWELNMLKLEGNPVDALKSAEHHDKMILRNVLVEFLGGNSKREDAESMYLKGSRFIADLIEDTFNNYLIPQLVDFNYKRVRYPKLRARRIGEQADWRTLSFAVRNFIGAGVIRPDDRLEKTVRDELDLPPVDKDTIRETATPQAPGAGGGPGQGSGQPQPPGKPKVGLPRQTAPSANPPKDNGGRDTSGGK
jgi:hypothetical protein